MLVWQDITKVKIVSESEKNYYYYYYYIRYSGSFQNVFSLEKKMSLTFSFPVSFFVEAILPCKWLQKHFYFFFYLKTLTNSNV